MIKFRAWEKVQKVMMVPRDIQTDSDGNIFYVEAMGPDGEYDEGDLDVFKLEQFTGLKDVNGKDIYEGDIVEVTYQYWGQLGNRYEVKFKRGAFYVKYGLLSEISPSVSVVGNVHENLELLEADK